MAQFVMALYHNNPGADASVFVYPPDLVVLCNLFDHLACKGILNTIAGTSTPDTVERCTSQARDYVKSMIEAKQDLLQTSVHLVRSFPHQDFNSGRKTYNSSDL